MAGYQFAQPAEYRPVGSRPEAPFLCIEGWSGTGDPEHFEGDLFEKPGMAVLEAGEVGRHAMEFTFHHDA